MQIQVQTRKTQIQESIFDKQLQILDDMSVTSNVAILANISIYKYKCDCKYKDEKYQ